MCLDLLSSTNQRKSLQGTVFCTSRFIFPSSPFSLLPTTPFSDLFLLCLPMLIGMAPEVVRQTAHTLKADIWSIGCLVVEMLTGQQPWGQLNQMQVMFKVGPNPSPSHTLFLSPATRCSAKLTTCPHCMFAADWIVWPPDLPTRHHICRRGLPQQDVHPRSSGSAEREGVVGASIHHRGTRVEIRLRERFVLCPFLPFVSSSLVPLHLSVIPFPIFVTSNISLITIPFPYPSSPSLSRSLE